MGSVVVVPGIMSGDFCSLSLTAEGWLLPGNAANGPAVRRLSARMGESKMAGAGRREREKVQFAVGTLAGAMNRRYLGISFPKRIL